jgi:hypothetical protein
MACRLSARPRGQCGVVLSTLDQTNLAISHRLAGRRGVAGGVRGRMRLLLLVAALAAASPAFAARMPTHVGQCTISVVKKVETRLMGGPDQTVAGSGSAIDFANGGSQVSYEQVMAVDHSRPGDRARICLVSIPENCPPGDNRGRMYRTTNLRTHQSWTLPDSEHMCGGA